MLSLRTTEAPTSIPQKSTRNVTLKNAHSIDTPVEEPAAKKRKTNPVTPTGFFSNPGRSKLTIHIKTKNGEFTVLRHNPPVINHTKKREEPVMAHRQFTIKTKAERALELMAAQKKLEMSIQHNDEKPTQPVLAANTYRGADAILLAELIGGAVFTKTEKENVLKASTSDSSSSDSNEVLGDLSEVRACHEKNKTEMQRWLNKQIRFPNLWDKRKRRYKALSDAAINTTIKATKSI